MADYVILGLQPNQKKTSNSGVFFFYAQTLDTFPIVYYNAHIHQGMTTKEKVLEILKQVPAARDDDIALGNTYYWWHHRDYCEEKNGSMVIDTKVYYTMKRETIERIKREIQNGARKLVQQGKTQYAALLGEADKKKLQKEQRVRAAAKTHNIEQAL